ncbi:rod-determining factor RdfA [Halosimplex sp. J119]
MADSESGAESGEKTCCKLSRVARDYGIEDVEGELVELWQREEDRYSLRELAEYFNEELVREAMERHGLMPLQGEPEHIYHLLTDGDVSGGMKAQLRNRLEQSGIDPDQLKDHTVSYQTVNRHFKQCLDLSFESRESTGPKERIDSVNAMARRTELVAQQTVEQLQYADDITLGDFDVTVTVGLTCTDCNRDLRLHELVDRGGCDC